MPSFYLACSPSLGAVIAYHGAGEMGRQSIIAYFTLHHSSKIMHLIAAKYDAVLPAMAIIDLYSPPLSAYEFACDFSAMVAHSLFTPLSG